VPPSGMARPVRSMHGHHVRWSFWYLGWPIVPGDPLSEPAPWNYHPNGGSEILVQIPELSRVQAAGTAVQIVSSLFEPFAVRHAVPR